MEKFLEKVRRDSFWVKDKLNGASVKKHYDEIKRIVENPKAKKSLEKKSCSLDKLLRHAVETTSFYSGKINYSGIKDFEVVDKNKIRSNLDLFVSNVFDEKNLIPAVTSGSTGTPFKVYHDRNKKKRNNADTIYFANRVGYKLGDKLYYMKIWSKNNTISPLLSWAQNVKAVDVIKLDDQQIKKLISEISSGNGTIGMIGYASALELVARYLKENNYKAPLKLEINSIIAISESLNDFTKETLSNYMGTPVVSRYSNLENGIIAQQEPNSNRFIINEASYYVEVLNMNEDVPAPFGKLGRIVVTDLFNYALPMIRYDTGDIGSLQRSDSGNLCFERIEGRKLDQLFNTSGELISSYIVYKNMWKYTELKQYQLIQEGEKTYRVKVNPIDSFNRQEQLIQEFKIYLGQDAKIIVEVVDDIPLLKSGKRKKVANTYHSNLV